MANDINEDADLFAIPDFWHSSGGLNKTLIDLSSRNPLFSLDASSRFETSIPPLFAHLKPVKPLQYREPPAFTPDDTHPESFFRLPDIWKDLAAAAEQPPPAAQPDVEPEEPSADDHEQIQPTPEIDIWLCAHDSPVKQPEYLTWEKFTHPEGEHPAPLFITEAGPEAFDALLSKVQGSSCTEPNILHDTVYCASLLNLALGRSSILFSWDDEKKTFVKTAPHLKTAGVSLQVIQRIDKQCIDCANAIRYLQGFTQRTFSRPSTPTRVALAGVIDRLLLTVLTGLGVHGKQARSVLQLQAAIIPVHLVLSYFQRLVTKLVQQQSEERMLTCLFQEVQSSEYRDSLVREATAEVLALTSKPWTDFVEQWVGLKPEDGTGISKAGGTGKSFVKVADRVWIDDLGFELEEPDYFLDEDKMPSFIAPEIAQTIFETGRNIRFLRDYHPENPLSRQDAIAAAQPPRMEWKFDWGSVQRLEKRVNEYRNALSLAVKRGSSGAAAAGTSIAPPTSPNPGQSDGYQFDFFGKTDEQIKANVLTFMDRLDQPPRPEATFPDDKLSTLLRSRLYQDGNETTTATAEKEKVEKENFSPHWSLVPLLSFGPILDAQSELVNQECMRLLFSAHGLRIHVDLLRQCYLMGNGLLCSRLSHALFDADLETAERKAGVALGAGGGAMMGLRLGGGRENWPPASSELRLALMGVLSDSYSPFTKDTAAQIPKPSIGPTPASRSYTSDLPGDLSFAVRDLSPEEIDRCMNPDGLEALDFLQLSYKTPPALRMVITPVVLVKYDRVFRFLLRLLRMLYIVNQQLFRIEPRDEAVSNSNAYTRFRIESRHFVNQVASYVFGVGISAPWSKFNNWLDGVESDIFEINKTSGDTGAGTGGNKPKSKSSINVSPDRLQKRQERVLDDIMSALLLRKRQAPVMKLLEEIFGIILRFSKLVRLSSSPTAASGGKGSKTREGKQEEETFRDLYKAFRRGVEVFITVCRGLGEKKASRAVKGEDGEVRVQAAGGAENPIETLVLMLDLGGYYARNA